MRHLRSEGLDKYPIGMVCRVLGISRSVYYQRSKKPETPKDEADSRLKETIAELFKENHEEYGRIRMQKALRAKGYRLSQGKIRRLMKEARLVPKKARKYKATTNSKHSYPVAENLLNREFSAEKPNQKWCGDSTYIWTEEGWLYVAGIIDLYAKDCVGLAFSSKHTQELMLEALRNAVKKYRPDKGLLHHSDRGVQYASNAYKAELKKNGMIQSMSRSGVPYDNAPMESFWATVKAGCVEGRRFRTRHEAEMVIFQYVFGFYNTRRYHTSDDLMTPNEYRAAYEKAA